MNLDIRVPIGLLFLSLGGLLTGYGVVTHFTSPEIYAQSLDVNVNFWWGLAMLAFGAGMLHYGRRAVARSTAAVGAE